MSDIDRQFTEAYNAAVQLFERDQFEECADALRSLLADSAIPRFHHIKSLALLGNILADWREAYSCYVLAETMRRITEQWHFNDENPDAREALDDLKESLNELRRVLLEDEEGRRESGLDDDEEADVLRALEAHRYAGVDEDRAIAEAEGEEDTSSDEEMADDGDEEDMSDDEEVGDEEVGDEEVGDEEVGDEGGMGDGENMSSKDEAGDEKDGVKLHDLALIAEDE